jgi:peptidyl-prolyl cis-trans isomerase C
VKHKSTGYPLNMKLTHFAKAASLMAALTMAAPLVFAQNITTVNGKAVPKARVDAMLDQISKQAQPGQPAPPRTPELEKKVKDEIVLREIFLQEAERRGLQKSDDYKVQMEFARQSILMRALMQDEEKKDKVGGEAQAHAEYDKIKAANGDKEYRARHILVDKEEDAKALIAQIKGGAKFEELAKKSSKDTGSAENGGDLDWANPSNYVPEFSAALIALSKGQMTETPVKSQFGFHIIKLEDVRATQFPPYEEVKPQLLQRLQQQRMLKFREELKAKAKTDYKFDAN